MGVHDIDTETEIIWKPLMYNNVDMITDIIYLHGNKMEI